MILLMTLLACGKDAEIEDPALHACEHIAEAGASVDAGATLDDAPEIELSEEPYTVNLDGGAGFVTLHVHEDTFGLIFVDTADVVSGLYHDGEAEALAEPGPNADCEEDIPEHWDLDLHAGEWTLEFGPSAVDSIWLMAISGEGHDDHDH